MQLSQEYNIDNLIKFVTLIVNHIIKLYCDFIVFSLSTFCPYDLQFFILNQIYNKSSFRTNTVAKRWHYLSISSQGH